MHNKDLVFNFLCVQDRYNMQNVITQMKSALMEYLSGSTTDKIHQNTNKVHNIYISVVRHMPVRTFHMNWEYLLWLWHQYS